MMIELASIGEIELHTADGLCEPVVRIAHELDRDGPDGFIHARLSHALPVIADGLARDLEGGADQGKMSANSTARPGEINARGAPISGGVQAAWSYAMKHYRDLLRRLGE